MVHIALAIYEDLPLLSEAGGNDLCSIQPKPHYGLLLSASKNCMHQRGLAPKSVD